MKHSKCTAPRPTRRPSHLRRPDDEQIMRALDLSCRQDPPIVVTTSNSVFFVGEIRVSGKTRL
jgi:hypothetical protein